MPYSKKTLEQHNNYAKDFISRERHIEDQKRDQENRYHWQNIVNETKNRFQSPKRLTYPTNSVFSHFLIDTLTSHWVAANEFLITFSLMNVSLTNIKDSRVEHPRKEWKTELIRETTTWGFKKLPTRKQLYPKIIHCTFSYETCSFKPYCNND